MKRFVLLLLLLLVAPSAEAVGFRTIKDLEALREAGFDFSYSRDSDSEKVFTLDIVVPKKLEFESGGDDIVKPFESLAMLQAPGEIEEEAEFLTGPSAQFGLSTYMEKDGRRSCRCRLLDANAETSYIAISFAHPPTEDGGDWPLIVYVPVASLVEQLKAEMAAKAEPIGEGGG